MFVKGRKIFFITLKVYRSNFVNIPKVCWLDPAKNEVSESANPC